MSWVVTAYMLAETVSTVLAGKFGDLFGRKRVFQIGVAVFIIGSFFCGLASSMALQVEEAVGRITLRLVREADVEARRAGLPRATAGAAQ